MSIHLVALLHPWQKGVEEFHCSLSHLNFACIYNKLSVVPDPCRLRDLRSFVVKSVIVVPVPAPCFLLPAPVFRLNLQETLSRPWSLPPSWSSLLRGEMCNCRPFCITYPTALLHPREKAAEEFHCSLFTCPSVPIRVYPWLNPFSKFSNSPRTPRLCGGCFVVLLHRCLSLSIRG